MTIKNVDRHLFIILQQHDMSLHAICAKELAKVKAEKYAAFSGSTLKSIYCSEKPDNDADGKSD